MMNRNLNWKHSRMIIAACLTGVVWMSGCKKEVEEVVQAPPPPPPPAPVVPTVTPIAELMAQLNIDPRVRLPEDKAPNNDADRKAVLVFFDAFARGDSGAVKSMLPETDQRELAPLIESGAWKASTGANIKTIDVQTGTNTMSQKCALALIEVGSGAVTNFQPQLWYYTTDNSVNMFEAAPTPPGILDQLTGDWIATWHKVLAEEMALAEAPEQEITAAKKVLDRKGNSSNNTASGLEGGGAKGLRPGAAPIQAPGLPGGGERPGGAPH